jgi:hypothetical protein
LERLKAILGRLLIESVGAVETAIHTAQTGAEPMFEGPIEKLKRALGGPVAVGAIAGRPRRAVIAALGIS